MNEDNLEKKYFSYDEYRDEIKQIMERNGKRIKITEILNNLNISRGNFYKFMRGGISYNGHSTSTLSYEKLDTLMAVLRRADGFANNRQRLAAMSDEDLALFIEEKLIGDPKADQIDVCSWLKSQSVKIIYKNDESGKK
ncbi:MAG: hypothetical protein IJI83_03240 [Oscillospiraceae bacterium]|nr:hypothetical protein [Oscillospiraceae bacterium]